MKSSQVDTSNTINAINNNDNNTPASTLLLLATTN